MIEIIDVYLFYVDYSTFLYEKIEYYIFLLLLL